LILLIPLWSLTGNPSVHFSLEQFQQQHPKLGKNNLPLSFRRKFTNKAFNLHNRKEFPILHHEIVFMYWGWNGIKQYTITTLFPMNSKKKETVNPTGKFKLLCLQSFFDNALCNCYTRVLWHRNSYADFVSLWLAIRCVFLFLSIIKHALLYK
jgi:hypothetical protein